MKMQFTSLALAGGLALTAGPLARAQSSLYFDRNGFMNAAQAIPGHQQSITDFGPFPYGPAVTVSDVTFTGRDLTTTVINSGLALYNFDDSFPLGIQFARGARAFGADFSSYLSPYYSSFTATLSLDSGEVLSFLAATNPNSTFFGFISPIPIRSMSFSDGGLFPSPFIGHQELIGNIFVVQIPEPDPLVLFTLGALLLGWRFVWRHRKTT